MRFLRRIACFFNYHSWSYYPAIKKNEMVMYIGTCTCCKSAVSFDKIDFTPPMSQKRRTFYNSWFVDDFDTGWR